MDEDGGDGAERRAGMQAGASAGQDGGTEEPRGVAASGQGSSAGTDRSVVKSASGVSTTSSAGVFPVKFSSFPGPIVPSLGSRPVPSLFPSSGNVSNSYAFSSSARF